MRIMNKHKKIGIVTWHYYGNFGSALQSYASQEAIAKLGYSSEFVNYHNPKFGTPDKVKDLMRLISDIFLGQFNSRFRFGQKSFAFRYLHQGKLATDINHLAEIARNYDTIVCGSDQIWAPNVYNPVYFASFARKRTRKVSYAASIGLNDIPDNLVPEYRRLLSDFHAVSVRENEGKELLLKKCGIESIVVLDPTLLHDAKVYEKLQRRVPGINGKYLFCYFLNENHQYRERVERYARKHDLQIVGVSDNGDDSIWMKCFTKLGADHFIWLINHAEVVMTDSYHGSIFSLLFHKNFYTFVRFAENSPICQNSRIRQLQNYFGDNVRVIGQNDEIDENLSIDYNQIEVRLKELRESSMEFLKNALQ